MTLHALIHKEDLEGIRALLIKNPAEVFSKEGNMQLTPLHVAVQVGNEEIINLLLRTNPDIIDLPDIIGDTALQYAVNKEDGAYIIKLLCEKGADIDRVNTCGETCLYNSIYQTIIDENNNGLKDYRKTKLLLELGANCHVICSDQSLFELVAERKLSMDWWTLLLDFGAGIYTDFTKVNVDVTFLRKMTANQVVIGTIKDGKSVDRTTPGFEEAHTNEDELRRAIIDGNLFNFKALLISVKHLLKAHPQNSALISDLTKITELLQSYQIKNAQSLGIDKLIKNFLLGASKEKLPTDLLEKCETREKQLEQQVLRGGII
jgi:hypothetical protein